MEKSINYLGDLLFTITSYDNGGQTNTQTVTDRRPYPGREQDMENLRQFPLFGDIGK